jgi:hypothetical protein
VIKVSLGLVGVIEGDSRLANLFRDANLESYNNLAERLRYRACFVSRASRKDSAAS